MSLSMQCKQRKRKKTKPVSNKPHLKFVTPKNKTNAREKNTQTEPMAAIDYVKNILCMVEEIDRKVERYFFQITTFELDKSNNQEVPL